MVQFSGGRAEPSDFAPDAAENRLYVDYYIAMGMDLQQARAFYALTNSVPHAEARWLSAKELGQWLSKQDEVDTHARLSVARLIASRAHLQSPPSALLPATEEGRQ